MKTKLIITLLLAMTLIQGCSDGDSDMPEWNRLAYRDRCVSMRWEYHTDTDYWTVTRTCTGECTYIDNATDRFQYPFEASFRNCYNDSGYMSDFGYSPASDWGFDIPSSDPTAERRPYWLHYILNGYIDGKVAYQYKFSTTAIVENPYPWQEED